MPVLSFLPIVRRGGARVADALRTDQGRRWSRRARLLVQVAVAVLLAVQLGQIGWDRVFSALPTHPLFYGLIGLAYLALPFVEVLIYRPLWRTRPGRTFLACIRKRVFNEDLVGYAGEAFLVLWATGEGVEQPHALRTVRDSNILSSSVSMGVTLAAVGAAALVLGRGLDARLVVLAALPLVGLGAVLAVLRRRAFALSGREALRIGALYLVRLVGMNALLVAAWSHAVPGVPLRMWVAFAATQLLVGRIPFLPAKELLFIGAGVELAGALELAEGAIASVLLVQVVTFKLLNLAALVLTTPIVRQAPPLTPAGAA